MKHRYFNFIDLPVEIPMFVVKVHGVFGVTDNRRGLLWPGSTSNVLLVKKILSSVLYNALQSIFTDSPITERGTEICELVCYTVPKLSGVI